MKLRKAILCIIGSIIGFLGSEILTKLEFISIVNHYKVSWEINGFDNILRGFITVTNGFALFVIYWIVKTIMDKSKRRLTIAST